MFIIHTRPVPNCEFQCNLVTMGKINLSLHLMNGKSSLFWAALQAKSYTCDINTYQVCCWCWDRFNCTKVPCVDSNDTLFMMYIYICDISLANMHVQQIFQ